MLFTKSLLILHLHYLSAWSCFPFLYSLFLICLTLLSQLMLSLFVNDYGLAASDHLKGHHIIFRQKIKHPSHCQEPLLSFTAETNDGVQSWLSYDLWTTFSNKLFGQQNVRKYWKITMTIPLKVWFVWATEKRYYSYNKKEEKLHIWGAGTNSFLT